MTEKLIALFNEVRGAGNHLVEHPLLTEAARLHTADMAGRNRLHHQGSDGSWHWDRLKRLGYPVGDYADANEVVAWGATTPEMVVGDWKTSPGHWRVIMDLRYVHVGVAELNRYWTAVFARGGSPPRERFDPW